MSTDHASAPGVGELAADVAVVERALRHADLTTREVEAVRAVLRAATTPGDERGCELAEQWRRDADRLDSAAAATDEPDTASRITVQARERRRLADELVCALATRGDDRAVRGRAVDLIDDVEHDCPVWIGERAVATLEAAGLRVTHAPAAQAEGAGETADGDS